MIIKKQLIRFISFSLLFFGFTANSMAKSDKPIKRKGKEAQLSLKTDEEKISYAIGQQIGMRLKQDGISIDISTLVLSLKDVFAERESKMTPEQMQETMMLLQEKTRLAKEEIAKKMKEEGEKYLLNNKKNPAVKETKSGLQYQIVSAGKGESPKADSRVKVHYKGTLINGTEFDSSYKRNNPAEFQVNRVIPGWTEALQMMKPGSKWKLTIPSDLAYAQRGVPGIPPNSVLNFEVELIEVLKSDLLNDKPKATANKSLK